MRIRPLDKNYPDLITINKRFLDQLVLEGMDVDLIGKAIRHKTFAPHESHEVFSEKSRMQDLKDKDSHEYQHVLNAIRNLSALVSSPVTTTEEKETLLSIRERVSNEYELDHPSKKELLDTFRSRTNITRIQDYANYSDDSIGWEIDKYLNTDQQSEGKLITMLYDYIKPFADSINDKMLIGHERDYNQKDIFGLIAEILNLRWVDMYNYENIRTIYRNFQTVK